MSKIRRDPFLSLATQLFTAPRARLVGLSDKLVAATPSGMSAEQARACWAKAMGDGLASRLPAGSLPELIARLVAGVECVQPDAQAPVLIATIDAVPHGTLAASQDGPDPFPVWALVERPNPDLRTPIYNLEGPASSTPLGEIYPHRSLALDPRFVQALLRALIQGKCNPSLQEALERRARQELPLPSGRSRRFPR